MYSRPTRVDYIRDVEFEQVRAQPDLVLLMCADYGGQFFLTIPVTHVRADEATLRQLLIDLESITFGNGFSPDASTPYNAEMYCMRVLASDPADEPQFGSLDGLWLHAELEPQLRLGDQIRAILAGELRRLEVATGFPKLPLTSLAEARRFPLARASLRSGVRDWELVNCPVDTVCIEEPALCALLHALDSRIKPPMCWGKKPPHGAPAAISYTIHAHLNPHAKHYDSVVVHPFLAERVAPELIVAALRGQTTINAEPRN